MVRFKRKYPMTLHLSKRRNDFVNYSESTDRTNDNTLHLLILVFPRERPRLFVRLHGNGSIKVSEGLPSRTVSMGLPTRTASASLIDSILISIGRRLTLVFRHASASLHPHQSRFDMIPTTRFRLHHNLKKPLSPLP